MIKIENVEVCGLEAAIRGMRNPLNSWNKSDSNHGLSGDEWTYDPGYIVGPNDHELMTKLAKGGSVHAKYRRMIVIYMDITAPTYVWAELDTYKVGTVRNSCSFMHKGTSKDFEIEDFSIDKDGIEVALREAFQDVDKGEEYAYSLGVTWGRVVAELNMLRAIYLKTKDDRIFQHIRRLLPSGYNVRATVMVNYEVLSNMYHSRKNHRLDEWREFCKWIETLPYSDIITLRGDGDEAV